MNGKAEALSMSTTLAMMVLLTGPLEGAGQETDWDVQVSQAPETVSLDYVATEGTWMSLDVAPDGSTVVFDLLGHIYEMPAGGGEAVALTSGRSWNAFPRYSPDGTRVAFTSDRSGSDDLWILNRGDGGLTNASKMEDNVWGGSWSADGRHLFGIGMSDVTDFTAYRFNLHGGRQDLLSTGTFSPVNHFVEDPARGLLYFELRGSNPLGSVARIRVYEKDTGEVRDLIRRPGGAMNPALSPDGRHLAYVHRRDLQTELVLRDLVTHGERVLVEAIDRDRQEYFVYHHGAYPGMAWHPDGRELFLSYGGGIHVVDVETGRTRAVPFRARVAREIDRTIRFPAAVPRGQAPTRVHRWGQRTARGVLYETLGDLYLMPEGGAPRNVTASSAHETSPVYDPLTETVYYAGWTDDELGQVYGRPLGGGTPRRVTTAPSQYGALSLSADGRWLAYLRGDGSLRTGGRIESQTAFDLMVVGPDGAERMVTDVSWAGAGFAPQPPSIRFGPEARVVYYTTFKGDSLALNRVRLDGADARTLALFPHGSSASLSPDLRWIVFNEYHRSYVTPLELVGKPAVVSAEDGQGFTKRVDADQDGLLHSWSPGSDTLYWTRGAHFHAKALADVLSGATHSESVDVSVPYDVAAPASVVALTGVRVITANPARDVLENATVIVRGGRIETVGDVAPPEGARVFDLAGRTVMPGIVDVHAHYGGAGTSPTGVIEQRMASLRAALAHGVTTMYEVYGSAQKDFWVSDMLRSGRTVGPRLFSVGSPMYGSRGYRPKTYRSFASMEDVREHVRFNKAHGATALKDYLTGSRRIRHQLATAAREEGLNIVVEPGGDAQLNFARVVDGVTGIAHGMGFTPMHGDVVRFLAATEVGITPTLIVTLDGARGESYFHQRERLWEDAKLDNFTSTEDLLGRFRRVPHYFEDDFFHMKLAGNFKRLYDAGVSMQLGAHGQMLGLDAHWEMALFTHGGFSNHEAIEIATINGARHQGLDRDLGSIEAGKLADLIVLTDNPLDDIANTRSIEFVMKNGVLYSGDDAARVFPDPEPAGRYYFMPPASGGSR